MGAHLLETDQHIDFRWVCHILNSKYDQAADLQGGVSLRRSPSLHRATPGLRCGLCSKVNGSKVDMIN
jgi:hypothetical protein